MIIKRLGKVVWIDENNRNRAIFDTAENGLVYYDLSKDEFVPVKSDDARLRGTKYEEKTPRTHVSFGNTYLFFSELEKTPYMNVLRKAFTDRAFYQRLLAHVAHDCLRNGSSIKCGEFLSDSHLSYILTDIPKSTLDCDTPYYRRLSDDNLKRAYFIALVDEMRKGNPDFGRCCYVDSTPLPGDAENNPFNALCSHGTDGAVIESRLVLVLDIQTSVPVWFEIIPSNVLDKSTILSIAGEVKATLDVDIDMYDLDAGYARKELFEMFHRGNSIIVDDGGNRHDHTVLIRMPATLGYPRDELYVQCKQNFYKGRYAFDYEHHTFFGERVEIDLFGCPEYVFVFIDKTQVESLLRGWRENHSGEWESLTDLQQDWYQVKDGFFVLVGNKDQSPRDALIEYRGRARIEIFFRDGKAYLKILPLAKWTKGTVKGKIFHDVMETTLYRAYRKRVSKSGMSMASIIFNLDSWECFRISDTLLELKYTKTQVKEFLKALGYTAPLHIDLNDLRSELFEGIPMNREPVTVRRRKLPKTKNLSIAPEEKIIAKEQGHTACVNTKALHILEKARVKAERHFEKDTAKAEADFKKAKTKAEIALSRKLAKVKRDSSKSKAKTEYDKEIEQARLRYEQAIQEAGEIRDRAIEKAKSLFASSKAVVKDD